MWAPTTQLSACLRAMTRYPAFGTLPESDYGRVADYSGTPKKSASSIGEWRLVPIVRGADGFFQGSVKSLGSITAERVHGLFFLIPG
jgi:hypothetical protein